MKLEYNEYLANLQDDDVLRRDTQLYLMEKIKKVFEESFDEIGLRSLVGMLKDKGIDLQLLSNISLFQEGIDCKILKAGSSGWESGKFKVKISVEFIPDEPEVSESESPLDEIRKEISQLQQQS